MRTQSACLVTLKTFALRHDSISALGLRTVAFNFLGKLKRCDSWENASSCSPHVRLSVRVSRAWDTSTCVVIHLAASRLTESGKMGFGKVGDKCGVQIAL